MTKIKMLVSIASSDWSYGVNQVLEIEDELAEKWAKVKHCKILKRGVDSGTGAGTELGIKSVLSDGTKGNNPPEKIDAAVGTSSNVGSSKITS